MTLPVAPARLSEARLTEFVSGDCRNHSRSAQPLVLPTVAKGSSKATERSTRSPPSRVLVSTPRDEVVRSCQPRAMPVAELAFVAASSSPLAWVHACNPSRVVASSSGFDAQEVPLSAMSSTTASRLFW